MINENFFARDIASRVFIKVIYKLLEVPKHMKLAIPPIEFRATIMSHGYFWLKPFIGTENPASILIPFELPEAKGCVMLASYDDQVDLECIAGAEGHSVGIAALCLSLDEDLAPLRKIARTNPKWQWLIDEKKGRFLRSPSLFEDCLKAILTINIQWKRTVQMADALVETYGKTTGVEYNDIDVKAFPTPKVLAKLSEAELNLDRLTAWVRCRSRTCRASTGKPTRITWTRMCSGAAPSYGA